MAAATKKNGRSRNGHLPGMEPPSSPKIDRLADRFVEARDEWQAKHQPMTDAKDLLFTAMKEAGLERYETPSGQIVMLTHEEKLKVQKKESADAEE